MFVVAVYEEEIDIKLELSPQYIKDIRHKLDLTQQEFADRVGVEKVTVARWETGARKCQGAYAKTVQEITTESKRTKTIFDLSTEDLSTLDSGKAIEVFRDLLWSECRRNQIPTSELKISALEIADGGVDAEISPSAKIIAKDSFLDGGAFFFQVKAGQSWKPWQKSFAKKELLNKKGELGDEVLRCLTEGGWYVLVCFGNDLTSDQIMKTQGYIKDVLSSKGFPDAKVKVWGQQQLLGLFSRFPFLSLDVLGRGNYKFDSWESWNTDREMTLPLELGEAQVLFIDEIRRLVRDKEISHVRIVGEPGLGKTRLVHEALCESDLRPLVIYVPHAVDFQESQLFRDLLKSEADYLLILVLDECRPRDCEEIWNRLSAHSDRCKVITLDHESYHPGKQSFVELECPFLEDKKIENIINNYIGDISNSRRWAELCSGVPRVAHAVGRNLQTNPDEVLKTPSMRLVWERVISGYSELDSTEARQKQLVLRFVALFQRFGFETPVQKEGEFISSLIQDSDPSITYAQFQQIVQQLRQQKILQGKSTLFIAPKLLHIHLWTQFWEFHGRHQIIEELIKRVRPELMSWFIRMFSYAGESQVALEKVRDVLGPSGPFGKNVLLLSKDKCRFLYELSNASPAYTLDCIERIVEQASAEDLQRFHEGRQDIVRALEVIAVWPRYFERAARILRKMALSENSSYANNSTGVFEELFSFAPGQMASTGASPEVRISVLRETLENYSSDMRRLGIQASKAALSREAGLRIVGREYQGLKSVPLWTPETWGEVFDAMRSVWQLLYEASREWDTSLRSEANSCLINASIGLLRITALSADVLLTLELLLEDEATDLQQVVLGISKIRRFWRDSYAPQVFERLEKLDSQITGTSFSSRVRRIVHLSGLDDYWDEEGVEVSLDNYKKKVKNLAVEASKSEARFREILPGLVCGTNNGVFQFGIEYAKQDNEEHLSEIVESYRASEGKASALFLSGYLHVIFKSKLQRWENIVETLLNDEAFSNLITPIIRDSGYSDNIILSMLSRYDAGALEVSSLKSFGYADCLKEIQECTFLEFVKRLNEGGLATYVIELFDYVYCDKKKSRRLPEEETLRALKEIPQDKSKSDTTEYHWAVVAGKLIEQKPKHSEDVFSIALSWLANEYWYLDSHNLAYKLIVSIIESDPEKYWQIFRDRLRISDRTQRFRLFHWLGSKSEFGSEGKLGPLPLFPIDAVFEWVAEDPEHRAYELTRIVPKTLGRDKTGVWARELLNRYGDQDDVKSGLMAHFWAGGWRGNRSDRYRKLRYDARGWLEGETSLRVRQWLEVFIDGLSSDIERAEIEEEREF